MPIRPVRDIETADAEMFATLAHPLRLQLIAAIGPDGTTGDRLRVMFGYVPAHQWSWHLLVLRNNYLVTRERCTVNDLRSYTYRLNLDEFGALADRLSFADESYAPAPTHA